MRTNESFRLQKLREACVKDITGQRFGKLVVLHETSTKNNYVVWKCKCDCGNYVEVRSGDLRKGHTSSCGCLQKQAAAEIGRRSFKGEGVSERHRRFILCRLQAKRRGYSFELSEETFNELTTKPCHFCGEFEKYSGIDRMDNEIGYIEGNIVPCCKTCNFKKGSVTIDMAKKMFLFSTRKSF